MHGTSEAGVVISPGTPLARKQRVHRRHDEQRQQRAQRHAADDDPADLLAAFGSGAGGQGQRQGAQHHGAGGHQDRAQAQAGSLDHGFEGMSVPAGAAGC
jgi:hypothetical protein